MRRAAYELFFLDEATALAAGTARARSDGARTTSLGTLGSSSPGRGRRNRRQLHPSASSRTGAPQAQARLATSRRRLRTERRSARLVRHGVVPGTPAATPSAAAGEAGAEPGCCHAPLRSWPCARTGRRWCPCCTPRGIGRCHGPRRASARIRSVIGSAMRIARPTRLAELGSVAPYIGAPVSAGARGEMGALGRS